LRCHRRKPHRPGETPRRPTVSREPHSGREQQME